MRSRSFCLREKVEVRHTMNAEQIEWFNAGSALNVLRKQRA